MPKSITSGLSAPSQNPGGFRKNYEEIDAKVPHGHRPGYQGFIRGQQHYYGATYGEVTRGVGAHQFGPDSLGNPCDEVPPNANEHVERSSDNGPKYRLPGYAG